MDNLVKKLYTLDEARMIINAENSMKALKKAKEKRENQLYFMKQKIIGLALVGISIAIPFLLGDATVSLFTLPMGVYITFTKKKVCTF